MAARDGYRAQVELLIRCLPAVASAPDFALKGGTAINLYLRDMPRLSVDIDIDLTYLPISDRDTALTDIRTQLAAIAEALRRTVPGVNVQLVEGDAPKLLVDKSGARNSRSSLLALVAMHIWGLAADPGGIPGIGGRSRDGVGAEAFTRPGFDVSVTHERGLSIPMIEDP